MKNLKSRSLLVLLPLLLLVMATACSNEGFEGNASISGKVAHHGNRISGATVFIKFGGKEFPGSLTSDYDASVIADTGGVYAFNDLKKGDYYLYGFGYDSTLNENVKGGIYVKLDKDQDKVVEVPVTE